MHFREWVKALGIICTGIVIPFLGLLLIRQNIYTRHEITKTKEIIMHIMALICFAVLIVKRIFSKNIGMFYLVGAVNLEDRLAYEKDEIVENQMGNEGEILLEENVTGEVTQNQGYFQEEAARRVYEEYLEAEGYAFEVKYNAKGNLYIDLEYRLAGEPQDKSKTGFYGHKLVYDRASKNGKCEIFVLQRSHYTEGRMEEYREITGE